MLLALAVVVVVCGPIQHPKQSPRADLRITFLAMVVPWSKPEKPARRTDIPDEGLRGISLRQLQELSNYLRLLCKTGSLRFTTASRHHSERRGQRIVWTALTMHEICNEVIKPVIRSLQLGECSWVELVADEPQRPKIFISHSWKEFFCDFMSTILNLEMDRGLTARHIVWICTFANNQFQVNLGVSLLHSPFFRAFEEARETALFLDFEADALNRSWCTFELAVTTDTQQARLRWNLRNLLAEARGLKDVRQVPWADLEKHLMQEQAFSSPEKPLLLCTPAGLVGSRRVTSGPVLEALRNLETSKAEASKNADRRRILNYIAHSYFSGKDSHPTADSGALELSGLDV